VYIGRPDWAVGAHAYQDAQHNANGDGIGICLIGNFTTEDPTDAQINSLVSLLNYLGNLYGKLPVIGHKDVMPTQCPGPRFPWIKLKTELNGGDEVMSDVKIMVEGKALTGKILKDNLSYAPVRAIAEALGYKVTWDETNRTVVITK
jgi:N-acetyl-anhydromuramyl-L-alanine amidase AmpD